jgi:hypothetical protein
MSYKHIDFMMLAVQGCTNVKEMGRKEKFAVGMAGINVET